MRIALTGASGFLGWHTRLRLHALTDHDVIPVTRSNWSTLNDIVASADAVIHIAGINRGTDDEVERGNESLAADLASAVSAAGRPMRVVFANSIQAGNGTPYGQGKERASQLLASATASVGGTFVDVVLPNLFGEHGLPGYNSFVATFVAAVRDGKAPTVSDRPVELLHAQRAAAALIAGLSGPSGATRPDGTIVGVQEVLDLLQEFEKSYALGEFPDLSTEFRVDLFNTYRSALFPQRYPLALTPHADPRGVFVETVRSRGGEGQSSISTTVPGITRGEHYHLSKIERFAVVSGTARISLRKMFSGEVIDFDVSGGSPQAIDMPVGWVHNITNTGQDILITQFWSHEIFRPDAPDTFAEPVRGSG